MHNFKKYIDDLENQGVKIYAHYGKWWLPNTNTTYWMTILNTIIGLIFSA